jgi:hypothetical protein
MVQRTGQLISRRHSRGSVAFRWAANRKPERGNITVRRFATRSVRRDLAEREAARCREERLRRLRPTQGMPSSRWSELIEGA